MGINDIELVDPDTVSQTLRCPICFDVFQDPVFFIGEPCQHVFCRDCLAKSHARQPDRCPTCRAQVDMTLIGSHRLMCSFLDELPVKCTAEGCFWTGRLDSRAAHRSACAALELIAAKNALKAQSDQQEQLKIEFEELRTQSTKQMQSLKRKGDDIQTLRLLLAESRKQVELQDKRLRRQELVLTELYSMGQNMANVCRMDFLQTQPRPPTQIFIKGNHTLTLQVEEEETILSIRQRIQEKSGLPPEAYWLVHGGKFLIDDVSLRQFGIGNGSTLFLSIRAAEPCIGASASRSAMESF